MLQLAYNLSFPDLYRRDGLLKIDAHFLDFLGAAAPSVKERLVAARAAEAPLLQKEESTLLLDIAPHLERFLSQLFGIADEVLALAAKHDELSPLYTVKRQFVQRRAATKIKAAEAVTFDGIELERQLSE